MKPHVRIYIAWAICLSLGFAFWGAVLYVVFGVWGT